MSSKYKLICGGDPKSLGIEKPNGDWDIVALGEHISKCKECKAFTAYIFIAATRVFDE